MSYPLTVALASAEGSVASTVEPESQSVAVGTAEATRAPEEPAADIDSDFAQDSQCIGVEFVVVQDIQSPAAEAVVEQDIRSSEAAMPAGSRSVVVRKHSAAEADHIAGHIEVDLGGLHLRHQGMNWNWRTCQKVSIIAGVVLQCSSG